MSQSISCQFSMFFSAMISEQFSSPASVLDGQPLPPLSCQSNWLLQSNRCNKFFCRVKRHTLLAATTIAAMCLESVSPLTLGRSDNVGSTDIDCKILTRSAKIGAIKVEHVIIYILLNFAYTTLDTPKNKAFQSLLFWI